LTDAASVLSCKIRDGVGAGTEGWFGDYVVLRVGDGADTSFWLDRWCGDVPFRVHFSRLFDLVVDKSVTVRNTFFSRLGERGRRGSGVGVCGCGMRRY